MFLAVHFGNYAEVAISEHLRKEASQKKVFTVAVNSTPILGGILAPPALVYLRQRSKAARLARDMAREEVNILRKELEEGDAEENGGTYEI